MRRALLLLLALAAGCRQGSAVYVTVTAAQPLDAAILHLTVAAGGQAASYDVPLSVPTFPPDHHVTIDVSPGISGTLSVAVQATDAQGRSVGGSGAGSGVVTIAEGGTGDLTILLGGAAPGDASVAGDLSLGDAGGCTSNPDCPAARPICDKGSCRPCQAHAECASGACADDGSCVDPKMVAYVNNFGKTPTACAASGIHDGFAPATGFCTIPLGLVAGQKYVVVSGSTAPYDGFAASVPAESGDVLIGPGLAANPLATVAVAGNAYYAIADDLAQLTIDGLDVAGEIDCRQSGTLVFRNGAIHDASLASGASTAIQSMGCHLTVENSLIHDNTGSGLDLFQGTATVSRSQITNTAPNMPQAAIHGHSDGTPDSLVVDSSTIGPNNGTAMLLDGSGFVLTNNFIIDNTGWALIPLVDGGRFQFNTVAGNLRAVNCAPASTTFPLEDSIFVDNDKMGGGPGFEFNGGCPRWNSIDSTSVNQPVFKDPMNHDYRLVADNPKNLDCCVDKVSATVDGGLPTLSDHDYFGIHRPQGKASDIGAHEVQ